jgi:hypothetical protein
MSENPSSQVALAPPKSPRLVPHASTDSLRLAAWEERQAALEERVAQFEVQLAHVQAIPANFFPSLSGNIQRIADHLVPPPGAIVGTPYVATDLGQTTTWVAQLVREGKIPVGCLVQGTGSGKPWKFYRERIDDWIKNR